jgi:ribosome-associated protein
LTQNNGPQTEQSTPIAPDALVVLIQQILDDHKAEEIVTIGLKGKSSIADYMVIASGRSTRQVIALAENLIQSLKAKGVLGIRSEGVRQGDWVLIDAGDVIIHLFRPEVREFYNLEKMWEPDFSDTAQPPNQTS